MNTVNDQPAGRETGIDWSLYGQCPVKTCNAVTGNPCRTMRDLATMSYAHSDRPYLDTRIDDVEQARIAALREYAHRHPYAVVGLPEPELWACLGCGATWGGNREAHVHDEREWGPISPEPTDDGPGHDQPGTHERVGFGEVDSRGVTNNRVGPAYVVDPPEMVGLPAPDFGPTAAHQGDAELETRVRNIIHDREQGVVSRRLAARQIIRVVREFSPPVSTEGATVSVAELTAERFGPVGGER